MLFEAQETLCFAKEAGGVRAPECVELISSISVKERVLWEKPGIPNECSQQVLIIHHRRSQKIAPSNDCEQRRKFVAYISA